MRCCARREIAVDGVSGAAPEGHEPFLAAFADDAHKLLIWIVAVQRQRGELGHAHPCRVEKLEDGFVALAGEVARRHSGDHGVHLIQRQNIW